MKKKYVFHLRTPAVGEYEALFERMARKGWMLEKFGTFYSRFNKSGPQSLKFRMELCDPSIYDNGEMQEKQISLFREKGWTYITGKGGRYIFSAPEGLEAPDVYAEPEQRKAALRILRNECGSLWLLLFLAVFPLLAALFRTGSGGFAGALRQLIYTWLGIYYERTAFFLLIIMLIIYYELHSIRALFIYRKFKKQGYLDHAPGKWALPYKAVRVLALLLCLVFLVLGVAQFALSQKYELPLETEEPYLLLKDLGWEGERSTVFDSGPESAVEFSRSLLLKKWSTYECVEKDGSRYWMYQDIYELKSPRAARRFASVLLNVPMYPQTEGYMPVQAEGPDLAYRSGIYYLAVKDNYVCQIAYYEPGSDIGSEKADLFAALAGMLDKHTK